MLVDTILQRTIQPLRSLEELLTWECSEKSRNVFCNVPLNVKKNVSSSDSLKTLVCHDMQGGYLDDRFIDGGSNSDSYTFVNWSLIHEFVYFSHNYITIPPPGWISAAHTHGVRVLGTLITEWNEGAELCEVMFSCDDVMERAVSKLVYLATIHNFDGWLINIENDIQCKHLHRLGRFVSLLTQKMHKAISGSKVIWYDSVTVDGKLLWQNELNEKNKLFWDVADAIFLNYAWTRDSLSRSAYVAKHVNSDRRGDVYVGVDVFGRGCPGGGGFNTVEAVALAREVNLSVGIFAPGWIYENFDPHNLLSNDAKFWNLLRPFLPVVRMEETLPLCTNFNVGKGKFFFSHGQVVSPCAWNQLCAQQLQPVLCQRSSGECCDLEISFNDDFLIPYSESCGTTVGFDWDFENVWDGGNSLILNVNYVSNSLPRQSITGCRIDISVAPQLLWLSQFSLKEPLRVKVTHKSTEIVPPHCRLALVLNLGDRVQDSDTMSRVSFHSTGSDSGVESVSDFSDSCSDDLSIVLLLNNQNWSHGNRLEHGNYIVYEDISKEQVSNTDWHTSDFFITASDLPPLASYHMVVRSVGLAVLGEPEADLQKTAFSYLLGAVNIYNAYENEAMDDDLFCLLDTCKAQVTSQRNPTDCAKSGSECTKNSSMSISIDWPIDVTKYGGFAVLHRFVSSPGKEANSWLFLGMSYFSHFQGSFEVKNAEHHQYVDIGVRSLKCVRGDSDIITLSRLPISIC